MSTPRLAPLLTPKPTQRLHEPAPERPHAGLASDPSRKVLEFVRQPIAEMASIVVPPFFLVTYARAVLTPQQLRDARARENQTRAFGEVR